MSNILKLILGAISIFTFHYSFMNFNRVKRYIDSNNFDEEVINYIHSCEIRIIILLLFKLS